MRHAPPGLAGRARAEGFPSPVLFRHHVTEEGALHRLPLLIGGVSLTLLAAGPLAAQGFEEWKQQRQQEFQSFRDARDKAFMGYLESQWEQFEAYKARSRYSEPKPERIPKADPEPVPEEAKGPKVSPPPEPAPAPEPAPKPKPEPAPPEPEAPPSHAFSFLGQRLEVAFDPALKARLGGVSQDAVAGFWKHLAQRPHEATVEALYQRSEALGLNDWGTARLAHALGRSAFQGENEATLFTWFALTKLGYQAKVGFSGGTIYLLMPARQEMYSVPYFTFDGVEHYTVVPRDSDPPGSVKTYEGEYPGEQQRLDLRVAGEPQGGGEAKTRELSFAYEGERHRLRVELDGRRLAFYEDYPQTDFGVYFDAPVSGSAREDLLEALRPLVADKSEVEAVNLLLRFVQTAFEYQTDQQQFGREKPMFAEEVLYYPASDCEDRSVLFAYLARNLVGLEVVGLHYPNHLATAVRFSGEVPGTAVRHGGGRYVVADPTYINANAGQAMPRYEGTDPEVVPLAPARRASAGHRPQS